MFLVVLVTTLVIVTLLTYLLFSEGKIFVRRNSVIDLSIEEISKDLADLTHWPRWLPWLIYETDADIYYEYAEAKADVMSALPSCLKWQGKLIKDGYLCLKPARSNSHSFQILLEIPAFYPNNLHFSINLSKQGSQTLITMQISAKISFLSRWTSNLQAIKANKDLELALLKLIDHLAQYSEPSSHECHAPSFEWLTCAELDCFDAVMRPFIANEQPISQKMTQGFHDLAIALGPENPPAGPSFVLYNKINLAQHYFSGYLGIPIQNLVPCDIHPKRLVLKGKYIQIRYVGIYKNLALAWHVAHNYRRLHGLHHPKHRPSVEIYEVRPSKKNSAEHFVTKVCLPVK
ncbi:AraC family transcriptional regulator [Marinomonas transparens]|uniref:AraC family transcriptional regulator n=1 Tax=Marinomonas transparens TaxID=2795388 RepID=A0A934N2E3_9GAMM|nr:AraC family transcriptional regulator [Marinomonas transparens]MBJ7538672.1 AraC family transcriptional regulator [Marinomonas transparens]